MTKAANQKPRRLHLRLGTRCNNRCVHCPIRDIAHLEDRTTKASLAELGRGREAGCEEVVFMRGEPTLRRDLVELVKEARTMGYRHVQVQTNARMLVYRKLVLQLLKAGVSAFEVALYGHGAELHDQIARAAGAYEQTAAGIGHLVATRTDLLVSIPVIAQNFEQLPAVLEAAARLGARRCKLGMSRPVRLHDRWLLSSIVRLSTASPKIRAALTRAAALGIHAETEAVPICHLPPGFHPGHDAAEDWSHHAVSDLGIWHDDMNELRAVTRGQALVCDGCVHTKSCPRTWAAYLALFGSGELFRVQPAYPHTAQP